MSIKFEKGAVYNTIKKLGVVKKSDGRLQISQLIGKDAPDIETSEGLTFDGRDGGKLWFLREDGSRVCGHRSHFDAEDAYNLRDSKKVLEDTKASVAKKHSELQAAKDALETLLQQEEVLQAEGLQPASEPVSDEARSEAAALFSEA